MLTKPYYRPIATWLKSNLELILMNSSLFRLTQAPAYLATGGTSDLPPQTFYSKSPVGSKWQPDSTSLSTLLYDQWLSSVGYVDTTNAQPPQPGREHQVTSEEPPSTLRRKARHLTGWCD